MAENHASGSGSDAARPPPTAVGLSLAAAEPLEEAIDVETAASAEALHGLVVGITDQDTLEKSIERKVSSSGHSGDGSRPLFLLPCFVR